MDLYNGLLFHNRYLLVSLLGSGASAEVWKAKDLKANNLTVALKIFTHRYSRMDLYGLQNFEREFTTVYNMKHSNLLPPTGYDICDGCPYLVMQYCENGSANGMVGRMDEEDILKFLHDVAAGLEYLHDHNIIHQDIKPDNILLDDNCNFMVTDFGISVNSSNGIYDSNGMSGGTRAYMGPERFEGITNTASDIWSLGATAVELFTGDPPYGEHGGLLETEGEPLPQLPKLQPEVKTIILRCLEKDTNKRIKANEIRQKIELYWETGAWIKHSRKKLYAYITAAVFSLFLCIGIFLWDYYRTKVYYYKDYAEYWGIPKGIGRLSLNTVKHRNCSYRFEYRKHRLRRMALVNSKNKVVEHMDTEQILNRFSDVHYHYKDRGSLDYISVYDKYGKMLYKMVYSDNLKTATFRQGDEHETELFLDANVNEMYKNVSTLFDNKSRIVRYFLEYDDNGLLIEKLYRGLFNTVVCDKDKIYGIRYEYDYKGRRIEESFIGVDGTITADKNGMAIKVFEYDNNDDWISTTYLNLERNRAHDGNNCSIVEMDYDKYGNCVKEMFYSQNGEPSLCNVMKVAGLSNEYDCNGFLVGQTCLGIDGEPVYCNAGYVTARFTYNNNGYAVRTNYLDENDEPALYRDWNGFFSSIVFTLDESNRPLEINYLDENNNPTELSNGVSVFTCSYDDLGNLISKYFYDADYIPYAVNGLYCGIKSEYDEYGRLIREYYVDDKDQCIAYDGMIADCYLEYDTHGALTKFSCYGVDGKLASGSNYSAGYDIEYDEMGNIGMIKFFGKDGNPCLVKDGYSKISYLYSRQSNFLEKITYYDIYNKIISSDYYKYDLKGNVIETYTLKNDRPAANTVVMKYEYDVNNKVITESYCNLQGKAVNKPKALYSKVKYEYDELGNRTIETFWGTNDRPALDAQHTHKRVWTYDSMNRIITEKNLNEQMKPVTGYNLNPECMVKYDQWGNIAEISFYDGYGNPRLGSDGYFKMINNYDKRGNLVYMECLDVDGNLVMSRSYGCAKMECIYDKYGNTLEADYYNDHNMCFIKEIYKYNEKRRFIEKYVYDGSGNLSDEFYGSSKTIIEYDDSGYVPLRQKVYNSNGGLLVMQTWNKEKQEWQ